MDTPSFRENHLRMAQQTQDWRNGLCCTPARSHRYVPKKALTPTEPPVMDTVAPKAHELALSKEKQEVAPEAPAISSSDATQVAPEAPSSEQNQNQAQYNQYLRTRSLETKAHMSKLKKDKQSKKLAERQRAAENFARAAKLNREKQLASPPPAPLLVVEKAPSVPKTPAEGQTDIAPSEELEVIAHSAPDSQDHLGEKRKPRRKKRLSTWSFARFPRQIGDFLLVVLLSFATGLWACLGTATVRGLSAFASGIKWFLNKLAFILIIAFSPFFMAPRTLSGYSSKQKLLPLLVIATALLCVSVDGTNDVLSAADEDCSHRTITADRSQAWYHCARLPGESAHRWRPGVGLWDCTTVSATANVPECGGFDLAESDSTGVAFSPSSCGDCPTGFTLSIEGDDLSLGGGAYACPWICECEASCFSCSDGTDSNIQVMALFMGKDNNLIRSNLNTAQTAMSGWINTRMAEVQSVMATCSTEERSKESLLGEGSKTESKFMFSFDDRMCNTYNPDYDLGAAKVIEWHTGNLGTSDVWSGTYKTLLETELAGDPDTWITWTVEVLGSNPTYLKIQRSRNHGGGDLYYYVYLSKYSGTVTTNSGDLVLTRVQSIVHKPPSDCTAAESSAIINNVNDYLDLGEPVLKKALNKVRFQVVADLTAE